MEQWRNEQTWLVMIFLVDDIIYRALNPGCCLLNYVTIIVSEEIFHS